MNTRSLNTYMLSVTVIILGLAVVCGIGQQAFAVSWSEDFQSYADTTALKAAYTQCNNAGAQIGNPTTNNIALVPDPDNLSGNVLVTSVTPANQYTGLSNWDVFVWLYVGTSNPFPSAIFQNGTDMNIYYELRQDSIGTYEQKTGGVGACVPSTIVSDKTRCFLGTRGQADGNGDSNVNDWSQSIVLFNTETRHQGLNNATNGNVSTNYFNPPLMDPNKWYSYRLLVDWPSDGVTTNTSANCSLKIWERGTAEPGSPTVTWAALTSAGNFPLGTTTGDQYGIFGLFQNATTPAYNTYIDNVVFQDSLTPVPTPTPLPTATPTPPPPASSVNESTWNKLR